MALSVRGISPGAKRLVRLHPTFSLRLNFDSILIIPLSATPLDSCPLNQSTISTVGRYCRLLPEPISHAQRVSRAELDFVICQFSTCGVRGRCTDWTNQVMRVAVGLTVPAQLGNTSCSVDFGSVKVQSAADYYAKIYVPLRGCFAERPLSVTTYRISLAVMA